jgi:hypothetical protein
MLLQAAYVAAFWVLDECSALRRVAALLMPQASRSRAIKIKEEDAHSTTSPGA